MRRLPTFATLIAVGTLGASAQAQFASRAPAANFNSAVPTLPPTGCGSKDDGTTENALGLIAGGEMAWIKIITCSIATSDSVSTAYGTAMFPGSVTNGAASKISTYDNAGGATDPNAAGWVKSNTVTTVVSNGDTDILNKVTYTARNHGAGTTMVLASADQVAGQFPGPMDQNFVNPESWVVGSTLGPGTLNTQTLTANNVPPLNMSAIGFPSTWLLRLENTGGGPNVGNGVCFGDGIANGGIACPCGNNGATGNGCAHSVSALGVHFECTFMQKTGNTPPSWDFSFDVFTARTQPGLLFQGDTTIAGGDGLPFGDGIRCCGTNVIRCIIVDPPIAPEPVNFKVQFKADQNVTDGVKKCYQYWYRDPGGSPCGSSFNLSNAWTVILLP